VEELFSYEQTRQLVLEFLRSKPKNRLEEKTNFENVVSGVLSAAQDRGLYSKRYRGGHQYGSGPLDHLPYEEQEAFSQRVREIMWQLTLQGIIIPGLDSMNPNWPFFHITEWGRKALASQPPQPYDPDGFIAFFRQEVPTADHVVHDYLVEAVRAYMADCQKAAAVMLGAAHEKAILDLLDQFGRAIVDEPKRERFLRKTERGGIFERFDHLMKSLTTMAESKRLPDGIRQYVKLNLSPAFDIIRLTRNAAGHPEIVKQVGRDENFMNLRMAVFHLKNIYALIEHFQQNQADG
jgi:hypothetical protein